MRRVVTAVAIAAAGAGWAVPDGASASGTFQIATSEYYVSKIGGFRPASNPRLSAAIRVFGRPSRRKLSRSGECRVDWRKLKLTIWFANFGGTPPGASTCTPRWGYAQNFKARSSRFVTDGGLRIGDRTDEIPDLHPDAVYRSGVWELVRVQLPFGVDGLTAILEAQARSGRVRSLSGYIGGAGE